MALSLGDVDTQPCRPMLQWLWDADPTPQVIRSQLEQIAAARFGGVCIQPMPATFRPADFPQHMTLPYLGDAYLQVYRDAIEVARDLGLRVWMYDEGGWPSGHAAGQVLEGYPHLRGQVLVREAGRYIVERTTRADHLKREATDRFIELTHEAYAGVVGWAFGNTIEAVFSDELTVPGCVGSDRIPWTDGMAAQFEKRRGYPLSDVLPLLFEGSDAAAAPAEHRLRARHDFTTLWIELFIERCLVPQRQWCDAHGLKFLGHLAGEHDLSRHPLCFGDYFAAMRSFSVPGIDTIWRQIWPGHTADFALLAGSARLLAGDNEAMSETGAVYGLDMAPSHWRWVCDQQIMRGINRFSVMSLTLSGAANEGLSPLALTDPTWPAWAEVNDRLALAATLASIGQPVVTRAVLYPSADMAARGPDAPGQAAQRIIACLHRRGGGVMYVDTPSLLHGTLEAGAIRCGQARIETLWLAGGSVLSLDLQRRLVELQRGGVEVFTVGDPVLLGSDGSRWTPEQHGLRHVQWDDMAQAPIGGSRPLAHARRSGARVSQLHRKGNGWHLLLLFNESDEAEEVAVAVPDDAVIFDLQQTLRRVGAVEQGVVSLRPGAMMALAWGAVDVAGVPSQALPSSAEPVRQITLHNWTLRPNWRLVISEHRWQRRPVNAAPQSTQLGDWRGTLGADFSGCACYETTFDLEHRHRIACLDLGRVDHVAELWVNGQSLGRRIWTPYAWEVGPILRKGSNDVRVCVSNAPAAAYWSKENQVREQAAGRTNVYAERIAERCPPDRGAGLLGPVTLQLFD